MNSFHFNKGFSLVEILIISTISLTVFVSVIYQMFFTTSIIIKTKHSSQAFNLAIEGSNLIKRINFDYLTKENIKYLNDLLTINNINNISYRPDMMKTYTELNKSNFYKFSYPVSWSKRFLREVDIVFSSDLFKIIEIKVIWKEKEKAKKHVVKLTVYNDKMSDI